jgi:hypothetical protein
MHQAAVLLPPPLPWLMHAMAGPVTRMWPCGPTPRRVPTSSTNASLAATALAFGQGWPGEHDPSISRAAMPASRIRVPSLHHIGPSPSQTCVGVQEKD